MRIAGSPRQPHGSAHEPRRPCRDHRRWRDRQRLGRALRIVRSGGAYRRSGSARARERTLRKGAESGRILRSANAADAVRGAVWVQESVPEGLVLKRTVLASLEGVLSKDAIVASSTSTLGATVLGEGRSFASRLLVAHPLYPVYAVPVVELCGGRETTQATMARAAETLRLAGREPIIVHRELPGLVANR